jgi:allantoate deiminase
MELPDWAEGELGARVAERIEALAAISDEQGAITRLYLSPAHRAAVDQMTQWMQAAGMATHLDATASLIGHYAGLTPDAPVLLIGSHIDSVRNAGKYDGTLGVIAGLVALEDFHRRGIRFPFAIELIAFGDEEGVRFASTLSGSRALAGRVDPAILNERDSDGITRREALVAFGCDPDAIASMRRDPARMLAYLELHIEQGPVLEARQVPVGIVTAINGARRGRLTLTGKASHAGTTPMTMRRDALTAASEIILRVETIASGYGEIVATVGELQVPGGAINTVPGKVVLSIDVRGACDTRRDRALTEILDAARAIAERRGIGLDIDMRYEAPAAPCDPHVVSGLQRACSVLGLNCEKLPSGAGHDAMVFKGLIPFGMIFVRSRDGLSHHPDEYSSPEDIDVATRMLAAFILQYAVDPAFLRNQG